MVSLLNQPISIHMLNTVSMIMYLTQRNHYLPSEYAFLVEDWHTVVPDLVGLIADKLNKLRNFMEVSNKPY